MKVFNVYFLKHAFDAALEHAEQKAGDGVEALGLLAGFVYCFNNKKFVVATDYLSAENEATAVSVKFSGKAFASLVKQLNALDGEKIVVGWSHSHPGFGCFMSAVDQATQEKYFDEDFHVALVLDPFRRQQEAFVGGGCGRASFAVVKKKE